MSLTVSLSLGSGACGNGVVADNNSNAVVTITNNASSSVTLTSLQISLPAGCSSYISQPVFMTPNVPPGTGNPTIGASSSVSFGFQFAVNSPNMPSSSPQSPGGASGNKAMEAQSLVYLSAQALASDGSIGLASLPVAVLTATAPFPVAQGGAFQQAYGLNAVNFLAAFA